jgi:transcriptional regulator with XRE-family HTH domain
MLTPEVCRAARGLLGWTIRQLSQASGVGIMTISAFERGSRPAYASTLSKLAGAFKRAGVELILEEARIGAAAPRPEAAPLSSEDVEGPDNSRKASASNPTFKS